MIRERVGGEGNFWSDAEVTNAVNEALAVWQLLTGDYNSTFSLTLPAGQKVVSIDATIANMGVIRVRRSAGTTDTVGTGSALTPISIFEMDQGFYGRQSATSGTPEYWAPLGVDKVVVHPSASATQTVLVHYYNADPRMSFVSTDYINLGDEELLRILDYAQWTLAFKEGLTEAFENVSPLRDMFITAARLRNQKLQATMMYRDYMSRRDETSPTLTARPQGGLLGPTMKKDEED